MLRKFFSLPQVHAVLITLSIVIAGRNHYGVTSYFVWWCWWFPVVAALMAWSDKCLGWSWRAFVPQIAFSVAMYVVLFHGYHDWGLSGAMAEDLFMVFMSLWVLGITNSVFLEIRIQQLKTGVD